MLQRSHIKAVLVHLQVKNAYRELSLQRHPDKVPAAERAAADRDFKALGEAYTAALARAPPHDQIRSHAVLS